MLETFSPCIQEAAVAEAFRDFTIRKRVYQAWPLFMTFLYQVATGKSCREAVEWAINYRLVPRKTCVKTAAFCNARKRLPEEPLKGMMKQIGSEVEARAHKRDLFFGRRVKVVDGTTVQLPDTPENQNEYPQHNSQKEGIGFPLIHICAIMGLGSGSILDVAIGAECGHERALFRSLWPSLEEGDIVLGDAGFGSHAEVVGLLKHKVDCVFRQGQRKLKTEHAIRIGHGDYIVYWKLSQAPLKWIDRDELPEILAMRAVTFNCEFDGFRSEEVTLYTTLLDPVRYPKEKLAQLYLRRWEMELRLRDIKTTMGFELLKCKTPSGCRKELWMGLIAYNLIRAAMLDAALRGRVHISRISFKGALGRIEIFGNAPGSDQDPLRAYLLFLDHLIVDALSKRDGRFEPRAVKRRPKCYPHLNEPRWAAREALLSA